MGYLVYKKNFIGIFISISGQNWRKKVFSFILFIQTNRTDRFLRKSNYFIDPFDQSTNIGLLLNNIF
jgi:hypothetical protein